MVFPLYADPWFVTWRGSDEPGVECVRCLDLFTGATARSRPGRWPLPTASRCCGEGGREQVRWADLKEGDACTCSWAAATSPLGCSSAKGAGGWTRASLDDGTVQSNAAPHNDSEELDQREVHRL